jgi:hypothetical protein
LSLKTCIGISNLEPKSKTESEKKAPAMKCKILKLSESAFAFPDYNCAANTIIVTNPCPTKAQTIY